MMQKNRQQQTLDRWLEDHRGIVYKLVRVYAYEHHDQEDLFQEIVLQLWRSIPAFQGASKESTYVYQVALFAAMSWSQRESRRNNHIVADTELATCHLFEAVSTVDPRLDWLYEQISQLKLVDRSLVLLLFEGHSYREIADLLGLSESNVGSRLTRLKRKLAKLKYEEDSDAS